LKKHVMSDRWFLCVLISAILWGTYGSFVTLIGSLGENTSGIVIIRLATTAATVGILTGMRDRSLFRIKGKDAVWFLANGIASIAFFTLCYTEAIRVTKIATAAALLYTAPMIVLLLSALFFHEKLNRIKLICIPVSVIGCALVSGAAGFLTGESGTGLSVKGLLLGLGAGLGYALYSIFSRVLLNRGYNMLTCVFYTFLSAAVFVFCIHLLQGKTLQMAGSGTGLLLDIVCGIVTGSIPYLLYTYGMQGMENARAAQIATVEPVMAAFLGFLLFGQKLTAMELCGMILVIGAVAVMNRTESRK
jgi:drug/metabolite transporter, DME family